MRTVDIVDVFITKGEYHVKVNDSLEGNNIVLSWGAKADLMAALAAVEYDAGLERLVLEGVMDWLAKDGLLANPALYKGKKITLDGLNGGTKITNV